MTVSIPELERRIQEQRTTICELTERHEEALGKMMQLAAALVAIMMDPETGPVARDITSDFPSPVKILQKERNIARAQAMDSLLELGWPYHEGLTYSNREGADIADQFWRTEFTNRAEMYRNEARGPKSV